MTARDGVVLRADVYRPDGPGRFPVLLSRLPYDKNGRRRPGDIDVFVERGYAVIIQDTRGRFASEGDAYEPLVWEAQDGYDAVEWAAQLSYCDGNVGTMGQSYLGATQYLLAPTRPPHLRAAFPASAPADFHQCWVYHTGGAFELGWQIPYAILMARDTIARRGLTATLLPGLERVLTAAPTPWAPPLSPEAYRRLPLTAWAELLAPVAGYLGDYLRHPHDGPPWWAIDVERRHARDRRAHVPRDVVVRHLPPRGHRQLRGPSQRRDDRARPSRPEAPDRPVGTPVSLHQPDLHGDGRDRLRARRPHRPARDPAPLVRPLAPGHRHRHPRRAARADLRDGRESVARRAGVAARAHALHAVLPG